jgi:hypothetical protein
MYGHCIYFFSQNAFLLIFLMHIYAYMKENFAVINYISRPRESFCDLLIIILSSLSLVENSQV